MGVTNIGADARPDLDVLYRRERTGLLRLAFLLAGSRELAEDAVQTAFAAAAARWVDIEEPLAYLRKVIVNHTKDAHRRRLRERARPAAREGMRELPELDETWAELRRLSANQRAVVVLRYYADLPLTTIAELLDRPAATVRSDHHRALDNLRRHLR